MFFILQPKNIIEGYQQSKYSVSGLTKGLSGDEESFRMIASRDLVDSIKRRILYGDPEIRKLHF